ncbi:unnamed protein product [Prorocentrum cordatum]|uniref:HECT domain-containing protein n=1 Tax=Prorocentrum cordatum TaxID=2364126 RepID=A0ABN9SJ90_9DINO|nr:unnamed protein product [Polarella glacialis]
MWRTGGSRKRKSWRPPACAPGEGDPHDGDRGNRASAPPPAGPHGDPEEQCCCLPPRACWDGSACGVCPGALTVWRSARGPRGDMLLLGLLECPRLTALVLHGLGIELGEAVPMAQSGSRVVESLRCAVRGATRWGAWSPAAAWILCPWLEAVASLLSLAPDSLWWVVAFVNAGALSLWADWALLRRILVRRPFPWSEVPELLASIVLVGLVVIGIALVLAADALGVPAGSHLAGALLRIACARHALRGCTLPARLLVEAAQRDGGWQRAGLRAAAGCACALSLALCSLSSNLRFDLCTILLMLGPGALWWTKLSESVLSDVGAYVQPMKIDRARLLDSSVEALSSLPPAELRRGIPAVAFVDSGRASRRRSPELAEDGIDAGGMGRDWLNRFIVEAFDPANGLVDTATVNGRAYARLKKGASVARLEAVGKAVGLALRAGQPLGVDLCAPLAHLLAHRRLPQALESVHAGLGGAAAPGPPGGAPPSGRRSAGWERLQLRLAARGRAVRRLKAAAEQVLLGFSREWLIWASPEEHAYWSRCLSEDLPASDRAGLVEAAGAVTVDDAPVTLENLPEHMARRALDELLLDVREETLALWRGLHSIPHVKVPRLAREARSSKRLRQCVEDEEEARLRKRLRTADAGQASASTPPRAPLPVGAATAGPAAPAPAAAHGDLGPSGDAGAPAAAPWASAPPPSSSAAAAPLLRRAARASAAGPHAFAPGSAPDGLGSLGELGEQAATPWAATLPPSGLGAPPSSSCSSSPCATFTHRSGATCRRGCARRSRRWRAAREPTGQAAAPRFRA